MQNIPKITHTRWQHLKISVWHFTTHHRRRIRNFVMTSLLPADFQQLHLHMPSFNESYVVLVVAVRSGYNAHEVELIAQILQQ